MDLLVPGQNVRRAKNRFFRAIAMHSYPQRDKGLKSCRSWDTVPHNGSAQHPEVHVPRWQTHAGDQDWMRVLHRCSGFLPLYQANSDQRSIQLQKLLCLPLSGVSAGSGEKVKGELLAVIHEMFTASQ